MAKLENKSVGYILRLLNQEVEQRRKAAWDAMLEEELDADELLASAMDYRRARDEAVNFEEFARKQNEEAAE